MPPLISTNDCSMSPSVAAGGVAVSVPVSAPAAGRPVSRATHSSASTSAWRSVKPLRTRFFTNRWVSTTTNADMAAS